PLPAELIAQEPTTARDASRLLHLHPDGTVFDHSFGDLVELLPGNAVLVANDTRVIPARVLGKKDTGGNAELLFLEPDAPGPCRCLARARRPLHAGQTIRVGDIGLTLASDRAADGSVAVTIPGDALAFLDAHGDVPLPRYISRSDRPDDRER